VSVICAERARAQLAEDIALHKALGSELPELEARFGPLRDKFRALARPEARMRGPRTQHHAQQYMPRMRAARLNGALRRRSRCPRQSWRRWTRWTPRCAPRRPRSRPARAAWSAPRTRSASACCAAWTRPSAATRPRARPSWRGRPSAR